MRNKKSGYTENRKTWTPNLPIWAVVYEYPPIEIDGVHHDAKVTLIMGVMRARSYKMRLDILRPDELAVLREVVNDAFDRAERIVNESFRANVAAYKAGEPPHLSLYRARPRVIRQGDDMSDLITIELPDLDEEPDG